MTLAEIVVLLDVFVREVDWQQLKKTDMATLIRTGKLKYYEPGVFTKCPIKNLKVILLNLSRRQLN